jgi:predicted RNA-binding protein YlxR (DUF448 family)
MPMLLTNEKGEKEIRFIESINSSSDSVEVFVLVPPYRNSRGAFVTQKMSFQDAAEAKKNFGSKDFLTEKVLSLE